MFKIAVQNQPANAAQERLPPVPVHKAWLYRTDTSTWLLHIEGQFQGVVVSAARANAGVCLSDPYGHFRPTEIQITCTDKVEFLKLRNSHKVSQVMVDNTDEGVDHISVAMTHIPEGAWNDVANWDVNDHPIAY
jgi:plastocyanin